MKDHGVRCEVASATWLLALLTASWIGFGCASRPESSFGSEPEGAYDNSSASGHAFGLDGFTYRKHMMARPANDFQFYFKHCALSDEGSYYSKTSYWCTEP